MARLRTASSDEVKHLADIVEVCIRRHWPAGLEVSAHSGPMLTVRLSCPSWPAIHAEWDYYLSDVDWRHLPLLVEENVRGFYGQLLLMLSDDEVGHA